MNREVMEKWVTALRSGKYEQVAGELRAPVSAREPQHYGYCCLGVLCELHRQELDDPADGQWGTNRSDNATYMGTDSVLPTAVRDWAGLTVSNPMLEFPAKSGTVQAQVTEANDDWSLTFAEIADAIESQWIDL